jgi:protein SCO1/2
MIKTRILSLLLITFVSLLAATACTSTYEYKGVALDPPTQLSDIDLTGEDGQAFSIDDLNGDITLVYFGYTFCPDICPTTLFDVKRALAELDPANRDRVEVIFVSVDPDRDTPEVLDRYLANFDPAYIGLTSDDFKNIKTVMEPFGANAEIEKFSNSAAAYLVNHTARLYLLNSDHEISLIYNYGFEPDDLTSDLDYLLNEKI